MTSSSSSSSSSYWAEIDRKEKNNYWPKDGTDVAAQLTTGIRNVDPVTMVLEARRVAEEQKRAMENTVPQEMENPAFPGHCNRCVAVWRRRKIPHQRWKYCAHCKTPAVCVTKCRNCHYYRPQRVATGSSVVTRRQQQPEKARKQVRYQDEQTEVRTEERAEMQTGPYGILKTSPLNYNAPARGTVERPPVQVVALYPSQTGTLFDEDDLYDSAEECFSESTVYDATRQRVIEHIRLNDCCEISRFPESQLKQAGSMQQLSLLNVPRYRYGVPNVVPYISVGDMPNAAAIRERKLTVPWKETQPRKVEYFEEQMTSVKQRAARSVDPEHAVRNYGVESFGMYVSEVLSVLYAETIDSQLPWPNNVLGLTKSVQTFAHWLLFGDRPCFYTNNPARVASYVKKLLGEKMLGYQELLPNPGKTKASENKCHERMIEANTALRNFAGPYGVLLSFPTDYAGKDPMFWPSFSVCDDTEPPITYNAESYAVELPSSSIYGVEHREPDDCGSDSLYSIDRTVHETRGENPSLNDTKAEPSSVRRTPTAAGHVEVDSVHGASGEAEKDSRCEPATVEDLRIAEWRMSWAIAEQIIRQNKAISGMQQEITETGKRVLANEKNAAAQHRLDGLQNGVDGLSETQKWERTELANLREDIQAVQDRLTKRSEKLIDRKELQTMLEERVSTTVASWTERIRVVMGQVAAQQQALMVSQEAAGRLRKQIEAASGKPELDNTKASNDGGEPKTPPLGELVPGPVTTAERDFLWKCPGIRSWVHGFVLVKCKERGYVCVRDELGGPAYRRTGALSKWTKHSSDDVEPILTKVELQYLKKRLTNQELEDYLQLKWDERENGVVPEPDLRAWVHEQIRLASERKEKLKRDEQQKALQLRTEKKMPPIEAVTPPKEASPSVKPRKKHGWRINMEGRKKPWVSTGRRAKIMLPGTKPWEKPRLGINSSIAPEPLLDCDITEGEWEYMKEHVLSPMVEVVEPERVSKPLDPAFRYYDPNKESSVVSEFTEQWKARVAEAELARAAEMEKAKSTVTVDAQRLQTSGKVEGVRRTAINPKTTSPRSWKATGWREHLALEAARAAAEAERQGSSVRRTPSPTRLFVGSQTGSSSDEYDVAGAQFAFSLPTTIEEFRFPGKKPSTNTIEPKFFTFAGAVEIGKQLTKEEEKQRAEHLWCKKRYKELWWKHRQSPLFEWLEGQPYRGPKRSMHRHPADELARTRGWLQEEGQLRPLGRPPVYDAYMYLSEAFHEPPLSRPATGISEDNGSLSICKSERSFQLRSALTVGEYKSNMIHRGGSMVSSLHPHSVPSLDEIGARKAAFQAVMQERITTRPKLRARRPSMQASRLGVYPIARKKEKPLFSKQSERHEQRYFSRLREWQLKQEETARNAQRQGCVK